jgi:hypothetical protein
MNFPDGGGNPLYKYVGLTSNGLWGMYFPLGNDDFDRSEWQRKKLEREEREAERERQRREKCLDAQSRDTEIRKVLEQLALNDGDRRYLLGRGVPLAIIERCRSVVQWQNLSEAVHVSLPGVSKYGNRLNTPNDGILVAVPDGNGYLATLRLHDRYTPDRKYTWLSSKSRGIDPRLPNKEYPIGYYEPAKITDHTRIGLCEGMEWKAAVAANRLGFPVIGFSGCVFSGSMSQAKALIGDKTPVLIADAGAVKNPHVLHAYTTTVEIFDFHNLSMEVAWWGQVKKSDGDIDEIPGDRPIEFISVQEFNNIANQKPAKNTFYQACINLTNKLMGTATGAKKLAQRLKTGLIRSEVDQYYKPGEGSKLYGKLVRSGHKYILDNSPTGTGKTHTVSQLKQGECFLQPDNGDEVRTRIVYCPPSHRNPTNAQIEEDWFETAARNNGYYLNYCKTTDLGSPYRESLQGLGKVDDHERTESNCHLADKFMQYYAAGRDTKGICGGCEYREKCAVKKGDGFGYISESKKWIAEPLIRTSTQWVDKEKVEAAATGLILDEAGQVQWTVERTVTMKQLVKLLGLIRDKDEKLHDKLEPLKNGLRNLSDYNVPNWGYNTRQIIDALFLDDRLLYELGTIAAIEAENIDKKQVQPVFLVDLLEILFGKKQGSLLLTEDALTIKIQNHRLVQACHAAKWVICQDATWSKQHMAIALGIPESEIYVISQEPQTITNLTIEQWKGAGILGNSRTDNQLERCGIIRKDYETQYGSKVGFIDWKRYGSPSDLVHCGDSRGSNAYKEKELVVSFGLSRPNMSAVRLEYETLTGNVIEGIEDKQFSEFYNHVVAANLVQEIGRLRANRRQDQKLTFVLIGDGDVGFLEELGFDLVIGDIAEKYPDIDWGWKGFSKRYLNLAMRICRAVGREKWLGLSLRKCAELLDRSAGSVSKWVRRWFGVEGDTGGVAFERFRELVYAAIYGTNGNVKPLSEEEEIYVNAISELLPQIKTTGLNLGSELKWLIDVCGWTVFLETVKRLEKDYSIKLIARIFDVALSTETVA